MTKSINTTLMLTIVGGVASMLIYDMIKSDIATAAGKVNPADKNNVINRWFESMYQTATGSDQAPGADLYDWLHGTD